MGSYILRLTRENPVTLSPATVDRLIASGDGDASLLYLCLARHGEAGEPEQLRSLLGWKQERFTSAEETLRALRLIDALDEPMSGQDAASVTAEAAPAPRQESLFADQAAAASSTPAGAVSAASGAPSPAAETASAGAPRREIPPPPETAIPEYSREDVMNKLEQDTTFSSLLREVERKLGKLSDPSVRKLLGLYDYLGLPADVIYLLVNYCAEKKTDRFGNTRPPTMREVEKEGYAWARRELFSASAADEWLKKERKRRARFPAYMDALQLDRRAPSPGEEKYLVRWLEMQFPAETVAIAYDKTMLKCHELKWAYLNGILQSWHEKGLHSPQEVSGESASAPRPQSAGDAYDRNAWMDEFIK